MMVKDAVLPLIDALNDKDPKLRGAVIYSLSLLRDSRAVEPLISILKEPGLKNHFDAVDALGDLRDSRATEPLILAMKQYSKKRIKSRAWKSHLLSKFSKALTKITGQDLGKDPAKWEEWWKKQKNKKR